MILLMRYFCRAWMKVDAVQLYYLKLIYKTSKGIYGGRISLARLSTLLIR